MANFEYKKAIKDSFNLIFKNLYIFVPILLVGIFAFLITPLYFKLVGPTGEPDIQFITENISFLGFVIFTYILLFLLSFIAYGWVFSLIGQIVKNGKTNLINGLKKAPKKALYIFVVALILFVIYIIFAIGLFIIISLVGFVAIYSAVSSIILLVLFFIGILIAVIFLIMALIHIIPIFSLEDQGPIKTLGLSLAHFKRNKAHTFILLCIIVLFSVLSMIVMYVVLFSVIGSISSEALVIYMAANPLKYSIISAFAGIPNYIISMWSFAFLTIAYARKKKVLKK